MRCDGCQLLTKDGWSRNCADVTCLCRHGYEFCDECTQFVGSSCDNCANIADVCTIGWRL